MDQQRAPGTNTRPLDDTIAGIGPGVPDDALAPGESDLPEPPGDEEVEAAARKLGVPGDQQEDR